jgi:predicted small secreted protein
MPGRNLIQLCRPKFSHYIDCAVLVFIYLQTSINTIKTLGQDIQETVNTVLLYNITMHHSHHLARVMAVLAVKPLSMIRTIKPSYKIQVS